MAHNHRVIVPGGDLGTELFTVPGLKVPLGCHQDIGGGIKAQELRSPLLHQMIGDGKQRLAAQPQPLALHGGGHHFKGLARAYLMGQEGIAAVEDVGHSVELVFPQLDLRVHAAKHDMPAVVLPGAGGVEQVIVLAHQDMAALGVPPEPVPEGVLDGLLLLLGQGGLLLIQHPALCSAWLLDGVIDAHIPQIQRVLQDVVGVGPFGAEGVVGGHVIRGDGPFVGDGPLGGVGGEVDLYIAFHVKRGAEGLIHELLDVLGVDPGGPQAHLNLRGVQVLGERLFQRLHVILEHGVGLRRPPCLGQLLAHIAGEVFVRRHIDGLAVLLARQAEDDAPQVCGQLRLALAGELGHVVHVHPGPL